MSDTTSSEHDARKARLMKIEDRGNDNNYHYWASCAKDRLEQLSLWKYIEGPDSVAPTIPKLVKTYEYDALLATTVEARVKARMLGNEKEYEEAVKKALPWRIGDLSARTLLKEAIPAHRAPAISLCTTAKEIWIALREEFAPANETQAATLHQKILAYVCTADLDVQKWLDNVRNMYYFLVRSAPDRMTDEEFARTIANLLPTNDEWRAFNTILNNEMTTRRQAEKPMRSSEVIQRIKAEDWSHRRDDPEIFPQIHSLEAMRKRGAPVVNLNNADPKRLDKWCANNNCAKRKGHTIEECFAYGGGRCGQYPDWWTWRRDIHLPPNQRSAAPKSNPVQNRPVQHRANVTEVDAVPEISTADSPAEATETLAQDDAYYAFNSIINDPVNNLTCHTMALQSSSTCSTQVYHDSGANRHIFFAREHFDNYRTIKPLTVKGFGSSLSIDAVGVGDVHLRADCNGRTSWVKLSDVLHVPSARLNLVSQGCLERRGMESRSANGTMVLSHRGTEIMVGRLQANNLFMFDAVPVSRDLRNRISPPSLASRLSKMSVKPAVFRAGARRSESRRKVTRGFYTA